MTAARSIMAAAAVAAGLYGLKLAADAAAMAQASGPESADDTQAGAGVNLLDILGSINSINPVAMAAEVQESGAVQDAMVDTNTAAFLAAIAWAEGTDKRAGMNAYRVCYGYRHTIRDFSDHPAITGEWAGERLDSLGPAYVGKISTAAGRYQIIRPTWREARRVLKLADFSPTNQDAAAVWLIERAGALQDVQAGRFDAACIKCSGTWASMPYSTAGQPRRGIEDMRTAFINNGGVLA